MKKPQKDTAIFDRFYSKIVERKRGGSGGAEKLREGKRGDIDEEYEVAERKGQAGSVV